jgi:hypothetical protein
MDYDSTKPDRATIQFNLSARKILNKAGNFCITQPNFIGISYFVQGVSLYLYLSGNQCVIRDLIREFTEILQSDKNTVGTLHLEEWWLWCLIRPIVPFSADD